MEQLISGLQTKGAVHTERLDTHDDRLEVIEKDVSVLQRFRWMAQGGFLVLGSSTGGAAIFYVVTYLGS
jgi:hypothetical protein